MKRITLSVGLLGLGLASQAASIYVFSCTNAAQDQFIYDALTAVGHNVVIGQDVTTFTNLSVVSQYEAVYVQANFNWGFNWNTAQQQTMVDYVNSGGGLITAEWVLWMHASGYFQTLGAILPSTQTNAWDGAPSITYTRNTANTIMDAGLPASFSMSTTNIGGVRTYVPSAKAGATKFYGDGTYAAVTGWNVGNGRVVNFHSVNGQNQLADTNFRKLLGNAFTWVTSNPPTGPGVTGRLALQGLIGPMPANASFYYVNAANNVGSGRVVGTLDASGNFTIPGPNIPGTYRLYSRAHSGLRKVATVTTAAATTFNVGVINLKNGDCNNDNIVDIADYDILARAFGGVPSSSVWDLRADLNRDEIIDIADYTILSGSFSAVGD